MSDLLSPAAKTSPLDACAELQPGERYVPQTSWSSLALSLRRRLASRMRDVITLGPAPSDEQWARIDQPDYDNRVRAHCSVFVGQLRRQFGREPYGAELQIESLPIRTGSCLMVVCYFDTENQDAVQYALRCDRDALRIWDPDSRRELAARERCESSGQCLTSP